MNEWIVGASPAAVEPPVVEPQASGIDGLQARRGNDRGDQPHTVVSVAAAAPAHRRVVRDGGRAHREVLSALEAMSGEESPGSPHAGRLPARADRAGRAAARRRAAPDLIRQRCSQPVPKARRAVSQPAAATSGSRAVNDGHGLHITFRAPFSTTQFAVGPERVISNPFPERLDGELGERGVTPTALLGQTPAGGRRGRLYGASAVLTGKRSAPARVCGFHTPTGGKPEGGGCAAVSSESSRMTRVRLLLSTRRGTMLVTRSYRRPRRRLRRATSRSRRTSSA